MDAQQKKIKKKRVGCEKSKLRNKNNRGEDSAAERGRGKGVNLHLLL